MEYKYADESAATANSGTTRSSTSTANSDAAKKIISTDMIQGRVYKDINRLEAERLRNEAQASASWFEKDILPGINFFSALKIVASVTLAATGAGAGFAAFTMGGIETAQVRARGQGWGKALLSGALTAGTAAVSAGTANWAKGATVLGKAGIAAGTKFLTAVGTDMAQRLASGKKINWATTWDSIKSGAIKGGVAGLASLAASGIQALGKGMKYQAIAGGKYITGIETTSTLATIAASTAEQTINAGGSYAAWKLVERERFIQDLIDEGKSREEAEAMASQRDKTMVAESIKGIAVSTITSTAGLNSPGGSATLKWLGKAGVNIATTAAINAVAGEDLVNTSLTLVSKNSLLNLIGGNDTADYLKAWQDEGMSINLIGKDGFGKLKAGAGDLDAVGLVQAMHSDHQVYKRKQAIEQAKKAKETAKKKAAEEARKQAIANKNAVNLNEGAQLGNLDANPITDFNDPLKTALNGQLGNITFTDSPVGSDFSPIEEPGLSVGMADAGIDEKIQVTRVNKDYVYNDKQSITKDLTIDAAKATAVNNNLFGVSLNHLDLTDAAKSSKDAVNAIFNDGIVFNEKIDVDWNKFETDFENRRNYEELKETVAEIKKKVNKFGKKMTKAIKKEVNKVVKEIKENKKNIKQIKNNTANLASYMANEAKIEMDLGINISNGAKVYGIPGYTPRGKNDLAIDSDKQQKITVIDYQPVGNNLAGKQAVTAAEKKLNTKTYLNLFRLFGEGTPKNYAYGYTGSTDSDCISTIRTGANDALNANIPAGPVRIIYNVMDEKYRFMNLNNVPYSEFNARYTKLKENGHIGRGSLILFNNSHIAFDQGVGKTGNYDGRSIADKNVILQASFRNNAVISGYPLERVYIGCQRKAKSRGYNFEIIIGELNQTKINNMKRNPKWRAAWRWTKKRIRQSNNYTGYYLPPR